MKENKRKYPERFVNEDYGKQTFVIDHVKSLAQEQTIELHTRLKQKYMKIDQQIYDYQSKDSIKEIIQRKVVFDLILNRDIPSIFDPQSQEHKYT